MNQLRLDALKAELETMIPLVKQVMHQTKARLFKNDLHVKRVAIPNRSTKSEERRLLQKKRWFRQAQAWRTGSEGRLSVLKRRHGLNRCRYRGGERRGVADPA